MVDLVVVYSPVGGGHKAAALATADAARARGLSVEVLDAFSFAPRWAGEAYVKFHLTGQSAAPELYGKMYFAANKRSEAWDPVRHGIDHVVFGGLADRVVSLAPRAVIATHHLPLVVLGRERRKGWLEAPLMGVVTDYTTHACWAEQGVDAWAVPSAQAGAELVGHGVDRARVVTTGIPVRAAFAHVPPLREPIGTVKVLVTSGGFGVGPVARVVRSFAGIPHVELTIVCGAAAKAKARAEREVRSSGVRARVIGFEEDMAARLAEAHVVVGKAGGLTVSEAMTAGRPMVIASAVPGNEKINEEYVVSAGAGVAADAEEVGSAVAALRDRRLLSTMGLRARLLVRTNAAERVVDHALGLGTSVTRTFRRVA